MERDDIHEKKEKELNLLKPILKLTVLFTLALSLILPGVAFAEKANEPTWDDDVYEKKCMEKANLTDEQKQKLGELHDKLYNDKAELIEAMEEYGMVTKEQKERHLKIMKKHVERVKENPKYMCDDDHWEDDDKYEDEDWD